MNRCNFSLIATLYNTSNAGFYNDIYFPIIKYAITTLFYQRDNKK